VSRASHFHINIAEWIGEADNIKPLSRNRKTLEMEKLSLCVRYWITTMTLHAFSYWCLTLIIPIYLKTILCSHNQLFSVIAYSIVISFIQSTYEVIHIYIVFKPIKAWYTITHPFLYCRANNPAWVISHAQCASHWPWWLVQRFARQSTPDRVSLCSKDTWRVHSVMIAGC